VEAIGNTDKEMPETIVEATKNIAGKAVDTIENIANRVTKAFKDGSGVYHTHHSLFCSGHCDTMAVRGTIRAIE
jgi:hypothetical protein